MISRREFVKGSAAMVAGSLMTTPLLAEDEAGGSGVIGVQLWSIAKFLEKDFSGNLKLLSNIGYKELELYGPYPFSTQKDKDAWSQIGPAVGFTQSGYYNHSAKEFKAVLDDLGLKTPAMHVGLDTLRNNLGPLAESAHVLGQEYAGIASIPAENRRTLDDYKRIADEFNIVGKKAKELGIRFYYHNHGYGLQPVDGVVPFDLILERTDPSLVFFEMDIFWTMAGGADPIKYLDNNRGRFKLMHVKDMAKLVRFSGDGGDPKQWIELFPQIRDAGNGVLDLKSILTHAKKDGLDHFIVENDVVTDPKAQMEKGFKFVESLKL